MVHNYQAVLDLFAKPSLYPHPADDVSHLETHISHVFLAGDYAYKIKKPVDFGFLDFGSLESRIHFCKEELRLNRRLAPEIYLEVMALAENPEAGEGFELLPLESVPPEKVLEPVVVMGRMHEQRMMDVMLDLNQVGEKDMAGLARLLARFYAGAGGGEKVDFFGRWEQVRINVEENFRQTEDHVGITASSGRWLAIKDYSLEFLRQNRRLFEQRVADGRTVEGHGDLHSGNINLPEGAGPLVFDCIEFNDRFRYQDQACDLAFLAMDLDYHGRPDLSRFLAREFVEASGDSGLFSVLDFYKCYRAVVRAKIHGFAYDDKGASREHRFTDLKKARAYFRLAAGYAGGGPPYFLVCVMGLMGTGKSYLARHLAAETGWPLLQSDLLRKQSAGMDPAQKSSDQWGRGLYSPEKSRQTYLGLLERAGAELEQGGCAVVDASFSRNEWREKFLELALAAGAVPLFLEVYASEQVVKERLARRERKGTNASDGRLAIRKDQAASWEDSSWLWDHGLGLRVDGGLSLEEKLAMVRDRLDELGRPA